MRFIKVFVPLLFSIQLKAQIPLFPSLTGDELLNEIVSNYKPVTVLNYADARDLMYGTIYNENDSVKCVYTGHTLYLPLDIDPSVHLYMNGSPDGINAEHTYPKSKGASENNGNAFSDMHYLFPTRTEVNASRSNFPFGEIEDSQTTMWFYLNQSQSSLPANNIDLYSERINGRFEPQEQHKGNVARAVFYFFTMYKDNALNADANYFELQRETLCDWHSQDPVDSIEWERTYMIADYQNDSPNPFVLDSTLAYRSFCEYLTVTEELKQFPISVYPNPVVDVLRIETVGKSNVQVIDFTGRKLIEKEFSGTIELDFSSMDLGVYFVVVNAKAFRVMRM